MIINMLSKLGASSIISKIVHPATQALNMGRMGHILLNIGLTYLKHSSTYLKRESGQRWLEEYHLKTATYLKDIPQLFGEMLVTGNIIWSTCVNIKEYCDTVKSAQLDMHKKNRKYTASFAVALCKGCVNEIVKIYFNNEEVDTKLYNIRIYKGEETQMPAPLIQDNLCDRRTPAFRDLCYIVVSNLDLAEFNYKLPKVKCLIRKDIECLNSDYSKLVNNIADFIECSSHINPSYNIIGLILNRYCKLYELLRQLKMQIILSGSNINCAPQSINKVKKINSNNIVPIDGSKFLLQNTSIFYEHNIRITYLNAKDFKVKSYINKFVTNKPLHNITLPFAIADEELNKFYKQYKLNNSNSSTLFIFQVIAQAIDVNIGELVEVELNTHKLLRVIKRIYHANNTITLFCSLE